MNLLDRSRNAIAQGALTNSKRPSCFTENYPSHVISGYGCYLWDEKKKKYIDYICGLGTNLLGYANTEINNEIAKTLNTGISLSLGTDKEVIAAEKLKEMFSFIDQVKFLKTGSEACSAAIRIARAKTGRKIVLSDGYHGHHDGFVSLTAPAVGVKDDFFYKKLNDETITDEVAAVIVEPVITDYSDARREYLDLLKRRCQKVGAILIFDEVITGFRFKQYSVSNYFNIYPDLIVLGKAMANGMPLACVGGKKDIMECDEYFISSTYAGDRASLASMIKTCELLQTKYDLNNLWIYGEAFVQRFNELSNDIKIEGYPTRGRFVGSELVRAKFFQECINAGIMFGPSWFYNFHHIEHNDVVINSCKDILNKIINGQVELRGKMPGSPFAERVRNG